MRPTVRRLALAARVSACRIAARLLARGAAAASHSRHHSSVAFGHRPRTRTARRPGAKEETMQFCIGTTAKIDAVDLVKQAEDVGASHFGVGEGPLLFSDPYQYLALAARDTSTIKLGTWVTNPLTRIAPVTANSIATLNALAPGRTFLGIGTANNALRSMGNRPATLQGARHRADRHPRPARRRAGRAPVAQAGPRDRVPGPQRDLVQLRRPGRGVDVRGRPEGPRDRGQARRLHDLLPRPQRRHDRRGPPRAGQGRRRRGPPTRLGQARRPVLVLPAAPRRDLGSRGRPGLRLRPDQLLHHQRRLHERARRRARRRHRQRLHPGRDGLPRRPHRRRRPALPRGLGQVPARARPRPPAR